MKYILSTIAGMGLLAFGTAANAADAPGTYVAPGAVPAVVANWSGCYVGGHLGGIWGSSELFIPAYPSRFDIDDGSFAGGGQIGCNWQRTGSPWVWGVEGDATFFDLGGTEPTGFIGGETYTTEWNWMASLRGRIGYAPGATMFYVTGGVAWANLDEAYFTSPDSPSVGGTHVGWTLGVGVEHAFTPHWIAGVEYLYADFEDKRHVCPAGACGPVDIGLQTHQVRARLNYKW